ncbi:hypothetical protein LTR66_012686 [Elasticomyces elasticus]|nr:hypothetical protein LTR66_012686 [Elasticomyces elasticus]
MALHTPRRTGLGRTSFGNTNTASSPNLRHLGASTAGNRKVSLNTLTSAATIRTPPTSKMSPGASLEVGDAVNVPGEMHGIVMFIGSVKGKQGRFVGVELSKEFAARGKNDGDVEGVRYFITSIPGSGIFLPIHRAEKRASTTPSIESFPPTPTTPSLTNFGNGTPAAAGAYTPSTPAIPNKFSQSVGPGGRPPFSQSMSYGARAPSPQFKPNARAPLARPESPFRKKPTLAPTPARNVSLSQSQRGGVAPPRFSASPAPGRVRTPKTTKPSGPPRPYSRNSSRLGHRSNAIAEDDDLPVGLARTSASVVPSFSHPRRSPPRMADNGGPSEDEVHRLTKQLSERDVQLKEQATSLSEMERSLAELQTLLPSPDRPSLSGRRRGGHEDAEVAQLRASLREKNEKITTLTADFDAHRADFRSTIDTLELASAETERMYEKRVEDLMAEISELREGREEVGVIAEQLRGLEELVAELEEGLEDARRGEAEARGEAEFLGGEVERGRSELRREREKSERALKNADVAMKGEMTSPGGSVREVEQRDDEIRGLKAIIHSLSLGPDVTSPIATNGGSQALQNENGYVTDSDELRRMKEEIDKLKREKEELEGFMDRKMTRGEAMAHEPKRLETAQIFNGDAELRNSVQGNGHSERRGTPDRRRFSGRDSMTPQSSDHKGRSPPLAWRPSTPQAVPAAREEPQVDVDGHSSAQSSSQLWCEACENTGHDMLTCTNMFGSAASKRNDTASRPETNGKRKDHETGIETFERLNMAGVGKLASPSPPSPNGSLTDDGRMEREGGIAEGDEEKWCALCEKDGHLAFDCPEEQY